MATLSFVAAQVKTITTSKKIDATIFQFPNDPEPVMLVK